MMLRTFPLVGLLVLPALALAQPSVERSLGELPPEVGSDTEVVVVSDRPGWLHWGVDGWRRPAPGLRPRGSRLAGASAIETPLTGPALDGRYRARIGPLTASVGSFQAVLRNADGTWTTAGGRDASVSVRAGATVRRRPITIGRGPWLGRSSGGDLYEQLQDWEYLDCRGVDPADDARPQGDGRDSSRDLIAVYSRREADNLYLRADLLDLGLGDERGALDLVVLVDCAPGGQTALPDSVRGRAAVGWELAVLVRDSQGPSLLGASLRPVSGALGASFRSDLDAIEFGVAQDALRRAGWDGQRALRFATYTLRDGAKQIADAFAEASLDDGRLDAFVREDRLGGTAKYSVILHGNQAVQPVSWIHDLIRSPSVKTPAGNATGYARALDAHQLLRMPVNIHLSGTLASALEWAAPDFNQRIRGFLDGRPETGTGALLGGVLAEHMMPFFENSRSAMGAEGFNGLSTRLNDELLDRIYGGPARRVFWIPERVVRGETFADVLRDGAGRDTGYRYAVIDQTTHLRRWFGAGDAQGRSGHKLNRIEGVDCFAINDGADQWKFANTDGGLWVWTRRDLVRKALDPDQEQLTLVFDDWEAFSGRSFTSFGVGNDNPDNYERTLRWLANHPWVQVVTLEEVAGWGWGVVDRGVTPSLSLETYDWLRHASEESYANWYYGSTQEESFAGLRPQRTPGQRIPMAFGEIDRPGGLLHAVWRDVSGAPRGRLRDLAGAVASVDLFETAWHDEDQNDYLSKTPTGDYAKPDTTPDRISGWSRAMHARVGDAAVIAASARWSAAPPQQARAWREDVDRDGEDEVVLADSRAYYVFEDDGGRLTFAAVRDTSGRAEAFVCAYLNAPGSLLARDRTGESDSEAARVPGLVDWWADGGGSRYVNGRFRVSVQGARLVLQSDDGRLTKTCSLQGGALTVSYSADASLGTLYVRSGLTPAALDVFMGAPLSDALRPDGALEVSARTASGHTVRVALRPLAGAQINRGADFGGRGARGVPLVHQVEVSGRGNFAVRLEPSIR